MHLFSLHALLSFAPASGCLICDSERGLKVRGGIFTEEWMLTLVEVTLPFWVIGALVVVLNRYLPD